jgi:hypothetical protein
MLSNPRNSQQFRAFPRLSQRRPGCQKLFMLRLSRQILELIEGNVIQGSMNHVGWESIVNTTNRTAVFFDNLAFGVANAYIGLCGNFLATGRTNIGTNEPEIFNFFKTIGRGLSSDPSAGTQELTQHGVTFHCQLSAFNSSAWAGCQCLSDGPQSRPK